MTSLSCATVPVYIVVIEAVAVVMSFEKLYTQHATKLKCVLWLLASEIVHKSDAALVCYDCYWLMSFYQSAAQS